MNNLLLFGTYLIFSGLVLSYWRSSRKLQWWIEITTQKPDCIYYFGPFDSSGEAQSNQFGYIQDLQAEGASIVTIKMQQCRPRQLTIFAEDLDRTRQLTK